MTMKIQKIIYVDIKAEAKYPIYVYVGKNILTYLAPKAAFSSDYDKELADCMYNQLPKVTKNLFQFL